METYCLIRSWALLVGHSAAVYSLAVSNVDYACRRESSALTVFFWNFVDGR
jgi:hypothetical protein